MKPPITLGKSRPYLSPPELKVTPPEGGDPYGQQDPDLSPEEIRKGDGQCPYAMRWSDEEDRCVPHPKVQEDNKMSYLDKILIRINEAELNEAGLKIAKLKFKLKKLQKSLVMIKTDLKECIPRYTVDRNKRNKCVEYFKNKAQTIVNQMNAIKQKIKEYIKMKENITISELESMIDDVLNTLEVDIILDDIGYRRPYASPPKMRVTTGIDPVEGEYEEEPEIPEDVPAEPDHPDKETNALNNVPNQDAPEELHAMKKDIGEKYTMMIQCLGLLKEDNEYQKFFRSMLSKYGVKSPMELSAEKKKKFFNAVDKAWKGKKEVSEAVTVLTNLLEQDVTLTSIIMKFGAESSKRYNACMAKAQGHPFLSKSKRLAKSTCKYKDFLYVAQQLKSNIGMCSKAKKPEKCKKHVMSAIKFNLAMAKGHEQTVKKLTKKLKK